MKLNCAFSRKQKHSRTRKDRDYLLFCFICICIKEYGGKLKDLLIFPAQARICLVVVLVHCGLICFSCYFCWCCLLLFDGFWCVIPSWSREFHFLWIQEIPSSGRFPWRILPEDKPKSSRTPEHYKRRVLVTNFCGLQSRDAEFKWWAYTSLKLKSLRRDRVTNGSMLNHRSSTPPRPLLKKENTLCQCWNSFA